MSYLVWNTPNCSLVSYRYVREDVEVEKKLLKYQNEKNNLGIKNIKIVNKGPVKKGYDWFIDGQKCLEPEWSKIEREYEEMF